MAKVRPARRAALRNALAATVLVVASVAAVLAALEGAFRWAFPQRGDPMELFAPHPRLGWTFLPDHRGPVVQKGYTAHYVRTNPSGFRDDPFEAIPPGARRVAVLGDSFVSNISVEREHVFTERLEARWPGVSVMNLGVNGYGPVQELLLLEDVLADLGPDLVIVNVYLRNDLSDATGGLWTLAFPKPLARLDPTGRRVDILPAKPGAHPYRPEPARGLERLHVWHFLRERVGYLLFRLGEDDPEGERARRFRPPELDLTARPLSANVEKLYRITEVLLLEMHARARAAGVPLRVTLSPSFAQVVPEVWEEVLRHGKAGAESHDRDLPNRRLARFARANGIAVLDLTPALRAAQGRGEEVYHRVEQHWTVQGNAVVADALARWLERDPAARRALGLGRPERPREAADP